MTRSRGPYAPLPWIVRFAPLVAEGATVLDLACGAGRHTRFLLDRGHPVTAVDIDVGGLADLEGHAHLEVVRADLESGAPWPLFRRRFGAVVVTNYLWRPLFPAILDAVAPDGLLLYESFAVGNEALGKARRPEFLLRPGELIDMVEGRLQIVAYEHGRVEHPGRRSSSGSVPQSAPSRSRCPRQGNALAEVVRDHSVSCSDLIRAPSHTSRRFDILAASRHPLPRTGPLTPFGSPIEGACLHRPARETSSVDPAHSARPVGLEDCRFG